MNDETFELLKRIDAGFEAGSGDYKSTGVPGNRNRGLALLAAGDSGHDLRRDIMKAVEVERQTRSQRAS